MRVTLVSGVCVCVCMCGLETRSRVAVSLLEPNHRVFGMTTRECVARRCVRGRRNYVRYGAVCKRDGTVQWALGSGAEDMGRAEDSTTLEERGPIGVSDGIICVILTFWHRVCDNCGPNIQTES